jgi:hypothetical protein
MPDVLREIENARHKLSHDRPQPLILRFVAHRNFDKQRRPARLKQAHQEREYLEPG